MGRQPLGMGGRVQASDAMSPYDPRKQLDSELEFMQEGFGGLAVSLVIGALIVGAAVIWSMCK